VVGGCDLGGEALVDQVALAKEGQLSPSAGDRAEPSVTWQRAHQALRLAAAGEFAAVQDVDGVLGDRNAGAQGYLTQNMVSPVR